MRRHASLFKKNPVIFLAIIFSNLAHADNNCIKSVYITPIGIVDFDFTPQPHHYSVTVESGNEACDFVVQFSDGGASGLNRRLSGPGQSTVRYNLFRLPCTPSTPGCTNPPLQDVGTSGEVLRGSLKKNSSLSIPFYPVYPLEPVNTLIDGTAIKRWGLYRDHLTVRVQDSENGGQTYRPGVQTGLILVKWVHRFAIVSILPPGAPYTNPPVLRQTLDLGVLKDERSAELDLVSLYNAGFSLSIESENGSVMRARHVHTEVPYELKINGQVHHMYPHVPVQVASATGVSPPPNQGMRTRLEVHVPKHSIEGAMAATYQDILTVTITSNE